MKRFVATVMLSVAVAGSAFAADLPPAPPPRAPAAYVPIPVPVYNWGGFYYGINGGFGFGKSDWHIPAVGADTGNFNLSGGLFGGTLGANWQSDAFVVGLEGDFDATWIKGNDSACAPVACTTHNDWLATIRGRVGYAADRVLFYATAGGAFGDIRANVNTTWQKETKAGWTAGAGIEGAIADNWTARVEYLFVDLSTANFTNTSFLLPTNVKFDASLIRVGLMYKFR